MQTWIGMAILALMLIVLIICSAAQTANSADHSRRFDARVKDPIKAMTWSRKLTGESGSAIPDVQVPAAASSIKVRPDWGVV